MTQYMVPILCYAGLNEKSITITERSPGVHQKNMSVIIDGMDQNKTNIPHLLYITKSTQGNYEPIHYSILNLQKGK